MNELSLKSLIGAAEPLLLPIAHDALSALLIERAGFHAYSVGGFSIAACRYGLPDIGIVSFAEMVAAVRDIMMGSKLPILVDADEGYGDCKNVVRTVETYEGMGVAGIILEDQLSPKRCGHMGGKEVVGESIATKKIAAASTARKNSNFIIVARTDALGVHGLDAAIGRAKSYADAGADVLYVEAPRTIEEIETIAGRLGHKAPLLINMGEGGKTPIIAAGTLAEMGYSIIAYPSTLFIPMIEGMKKGLEKIHSQQFQDDKKILSVIDMAEMLNLERWIKIDQDIPAD